MRSKLLLAAIFLSGCSVPTEVKEQPAPVEPSSQEFVCEQLRSGATMQDMLDHEQQRGVDEEDALNNAITAINQTCPEFFILIEDHFAEGEMI